MRRIILLLAAFILLQLSASCSDSLFLKVQQKLTEDTETFNDFKKLYIAYCKAKKADTKINHSVYDSLYIIYYNKGLPLVRLIKKESLDSNFYLLYSTKSILKKNRAFKQSYNSIISSYDNFNSDNDIGGDGAQKEYFLIYLERYFIIPNSR